MNFRGVYPPAGGRAGVDNGGGGIDSTRGEAVTSRAGREPTKAQQRGCLWILAGGWLVWIVVDLVRLGVLSGYRSPLGAFFDMPSLFFPAIFAVGLAPVAWRKLRRSRLKRAFPGEPWMWERRWDRAGARSMAAAGVLQPLAIAVPLTAVSIAVGLVARFVVGSDLVLLALTPFFLAALGCWAWWAVRLGPVLKFGRPYFRYDVFPFRLGERVEGALEGIEKLEGFERLTLTLRCVSERWTGSGRGRRLQRQTIREETREIGPAGVVRRLVSARDVEHAAGATRIVVPVRFELPDEDLGTKLDGDPARKWELHARAERPGFDFEATFLLPVYPPQQG